MQVFGAVRTKVLKDMVGQFMLSHYSMTVLAFKKRVGVFIRFVQVLGGWGAVICGMVWRGFILCLDGGQWIKYRDSWVYDVWVFCFGKLGGGGWVVGAGMQMVEFWRGRGGGYRLVFIRNCCLCLWMVMTDCEYCSVNG